MVIEQQRQPVRINEKFKPLYTSDKRYFLLTGGRGSGKTFAVHDFIARLTYEKGHGILFTRYTMVSAEKSIIPEFTATLVRLGVEKDFYITKNKVVNKRTGSFIFFSGIKTSSGDQTANLKSLPNITTWVIEEGEDYKDAKSFRDIDNSIRTKNVQNRVIWIQNPTYAEESIIYPKFYKGYEKKEYIKFQGQTFEYTTTTHPLVENIHTTYLDNRENLNKDLLDIWDKEAIDNPELFENDKIGAWLLDKEGAVFLRSELQRFSMNDFNLHNVESRIAFIDVADRGTDSLSMPIGYLVGNQVHIVDWYFTQENQEVTIPEIGYKSSQLGIEHMAVEINGVGGGYFESLIGTVGCQTYPFNQQANKHSRILQNSGFIRSYFHFRDDYESGSMYDKAMRELFGYNRDDRENRKGGLNDDAPDSITGLWITAKDLFPDRWM